MEESHVIPIDLRASSGLLAVAEFALGWVSRNESDTPAWVRMIWIGTEWGWELKSPVYPSALTEKCSSWTYNNDITPLGSSTTYQIGQLPRLSDPVRLACIGWMFTRSVHLWISMEHVVLHQDSRVYSRPLLLQDMGVARQYIQQLYSRRNHPLSDGVDIHSVNTDEPQQR
jgi:hypothetical protein